MIYRYKHSSLYYLSVFLLPLVYGSLRIRVGAGWQLVFIPLALLLLHYILTITDRGYKVRFAYFLPVFLSLFFILSNIYGLINLSDDVVFDQSNSKITLFSSMLVNSVRYFFVLIFLSISLYFLNNLFRVNKAIEIYIYASILQGIYGIYEFISKYFGVYGYLLNQKSVDNSVSLRPFGTFYEPSSFGCFIAASILLYFIYISYAKAAHYNSFLIKYRYIAIGILFVVSLLSFSRSSFLSIGFSVAILSPYLLIRLSSYKIIFTFLGLLILISLIYDPILILFNNSFNLSESAYENTLVNRITTTLDSFSHIAYNPWMYSIGSGAGVGDLVNVRIGAWITYVYDLGLINLSFLGVAILYIFRRIVKVRIIQLRNALLLLFIYMLIMLFNYDSYLHLWIWFLFLIMYIIPAMITKENIALIKLRD